MNYLPKEHNDTVRCYPRTLEQAFPKSAEYAEAIEHYRASDSGLFEFFLVMLGLAMLAVAIGIFL